MSNGVHPYFDRKASGWSIIGFLKECEVETFENKIGNYIKSLETIIKTENGRRREKAQQLHNQYKQGSSTI